MSLSFFALNGLRKIAKTPIKAMNIMVGINKFSAPNCDTKGLIKYPALIPATDPPIPITLKRRLAWRGLNISLASNQN